jgi:hypothetical protein
MSTVSRSVVSRVACVPSAWTWVSLSAFLLAATASSAQTTDVIGVRAQGMAGAFTAVADDATATWWNPAGLAGGALFSGVIEYGHPNRDSDETVRGVTAAYPALGVSYYRLPLSQIRLTTTTAATPAGRQDQGVLSLYGATIGQSLGEHFVVGSTLKLLHATDTHADLDLGVMASFGLARFGVTLRDVTEPTFGSGADAFTLQRHVRAGAALTSGRRGVIGSATLAFDADLTREQTAFGDERYVAVGAEVWAGQQSLGLRGGISKNTVGGGATQLSGGLSAAVRKGTFIDAYLSGGTDEVRHGWGISLRVTF